MLNINICGDIFYVLESGAETVPAENTAADSVVGGRAEELLDWLRLRSLKWDGPELRQ